MRQSTFIRTIVLALLLAGGLLNACVAPIASPTAAPTAVTPEWFGMELTDVVTGETFRMNDFAGKVVLVETMAMWCPNCLVQAAQVRELHELLGRNKDLISVSLDVDVNEDAASLKEYVERYGLTGRFAIAPLLAARALGNLYTAQYLNPPLSPMLIIDRDGQVHHLEYGRKTAAVLLEHVEPFLFP
jgi:thiol-disulfide isomerase/thioredoxin